MTYPATTLSITLQKKAVSFQKIIFTHMNSFHLYSNTFSQNKSSNFNQWTTTFYHSKSQLQFKHLTSSSCIQFIAFKVTIIERCLYSLIKSCYASKPYVLPTQHTYD